MRDYPPYIKFNYGRAVFIDRDGTINEDTHFPHKVEDLIIIPKAIEGLRLLSKFPVDIIVISNQAGIALNLFSTLQMSLFNKELRRRIVEYGGRIDAFYYCPHLEKKHILPHGSEGCSCSKPSPGMLFEASNDFKIELPKSFVIGDRFTDIIAGQSAGCKTILVQTGAFNKEVDSKSYNPDYIAADLYDAALIVKRKMELIPEIS